MCREGILKENIDGEALVWANERAQAHAASRHIILLLSDGAPVDDSTLTSNAGNFLEQHLLKVSSWIETLPNCTLIAIVDYMTQIV